MRAGEITLISIFSLLAVIFILTYIFGFKFARFAHVANSQRMPYKLKYKYRNRGKK